MPENFLIPVKLPFIQSNPQLTSLRKYFLVKLFFLFSFSVLSRKWKEGIMWNLFLVTGQTHYRKKIQFGQEASRVKHSTKRTELVKRHAKNWEHFLCLSLGLMCEIKGHEEWAGKYSREDHSGRLRERVLL